MEVTVSTAMNIVAIDDFWPSIHLIFFIPCILPLVSKTMLISSQVFKQMANGIFEGQDFTQ